MKKLVNLQDEYLAKFEKAVASERWHDIRNDHFDWWQFPIDDGSRIEFNLTSEKDIEALKAYPGWLDKYHESIKLVSHAWGWDVAKSALIKDGGYWDNKDVRLAKIIRSLWLFSEEHLMKSVQVFANYVNENHNNGRGLWYGRICLDEVLYMTLPRTKI
jgi:hypothetical protein